MFLHRNILLVAYTIPIVFTTMAPLEVLSECWQWLQLCCKTSMAGPLGGVVGGSDSGHHLVHEDVNSGPP
jgi:hypothetical protein